MRLTLLLPAVVALVVPPASTVAAPQEAPRAARSVHLRYEAPEAAAFYGEVTVERSVPGSYFEVCGFTGGYFGIQEQARGRKVLIFSVWDPTRGDNPNAVPEDERVEVLDKADDVVARRFGGEGTGGQSFYTYDWQVGKTYRFLVTATVAGKRTAYAAYFYLPETGAWKHLVTFSTIAGGRRLERLYSFIEDFRRDTASAREARRATFGNEWVRDEDGAWHALTRAQFTASGATWEAKDTIDAGVAGDRFYLHTGGDTVTHTPLLSVIERPKGAGRPPDLPKRP
jgi:hypothetical protein